MNRLILLSALILSFTWMCSPDHSDISDDLVYGEPFYMTVGETVTTPAGDHIKWLAVTDNRCPLGMQCPIPGSGKLTFKRLGGIDTLSELRHYGLCIADSLDCGNQIPIGIDTLDLLYLYPYPDTIPYPDQDHYEAKFTLKQG